MYFRCIELECRCCTEGEQLPERCPQCGKPMVEVEEKRLSGDDWSSLGIFWTGKPNGQEKAVRYFRKSASMGSGWGTCNLGLCFEQGSGVKADAKQAVWLYEQAIEMGSVPAVCNLGVC